MSNDRNNIIYKYNTLQDIQSQLSEIITELGMREVVIDKIKKSIDRSPFTYENWLTNSDITNTWPEIEEFLKEKEDKLYDRFYADPVGLADIEIIDIHNCSEYILDDGEIYD